MQMVGAGRALACAVAALLSPCGTVAAAPTCEFVIRRAAGAPAAAVGEVALHPVGLAPADGRYGFATVSDDASFLLVDNRLVASWPGWHGIEGGRHGQSEPARRHPVP